MNNQTTGRYGEERALDLLIERGMSLIERNLRHGRNEVDLVVRDGPTLVFVEVKTRHPAADDRLDLLVSRAQQNRIARVARWYIESVGHAGSVRFDVVLIMRTDGREITRHVADAFFPIG